MSRIKSLGTLLGVALVFAGLPGAAAAHEYPRSEAPGVVLLGGPGELVATATVTFTFEATGDEHHHGTPWASAAPPTPAAPSTSGTPSFQCRLDSTGAWEPCSSPATYTGLADGPHRFEVRAKAGGHGRDCVEPTPLVVEFTVDTTPPHATIGAAPAGTIGTAEATVEFAAEGAARYECRLDAANWAPCSSPVTYAGLADGPHVVEVRAVDAAGNADPTPAAAAFAVDTTVPETKVDSAPAARIDVREATITFSATDGETFQCRLDSQSEAAWQPCAGSVSLAGLAAGEHTFEVRARDRFGRFDPTPARVTFVVDIPINGARIEAVPLTGTVKIKPPGAPSFRPLTEGETIAVGSLVDTTAGKVSLTSIDATGEEQRASFFDGTFRVAQAVGAKLVTLQLHDAVPQQCGGAASGGSGDARASSAKPANVVWGSGKGHFRTEGNYGSATVRGTIWQTADTCEGTFFKVNRGIVAVRDFRRGKTIALPAGRSYLARGPGA
jgi:hypothetical protein